MIGEPRRRVEDHRLVTGRGRFVDDVTRPGLLHLAFVRSPWAHADVRRVDTGAAAGAPGVALVLAGADTAALATLPVIRIVADVTPPARPPIAIDRVWAVGAIVAAVVADTPARAHDAAALVEAEYAPLPPLLDPENALDPHAPALAPAPAGNRPASAGNRVVRHAWRTGDAAAAFARANRVVEVEVRQNRLAAVPIEPRGLVAEWDGGAQTLAVWTAIQNPHTLRADLAAVLGLAEHQVRVLVGDVGGGFGVKEATYPEDLVVAVAARRLGRPVKWIAGRREDFLATYHGRGQRARAELALDEAGRITALRARIAAPVGCQLMQSAAIPPVRHGALLSGAYAIPAVDIETTAVLTTTTPVSVYRGAGRPEAAFLVERLVDAAARARGDDPAELRRLNFVPREAFPFKTATGLTYDSGDYALALDRALATAGYENLRRQCAVRRERGEIVGVGVASYVEPSAMGWESAGVRVERDGRVTVTTGACATGQGHETTFAQIAAERLAIAPESVRVIAGSTEGRPVGIGTIGSRSTALAGSALVAACARVLEQARRLAGALFEAAPDDVLLGPGGEFHVAGAPDRRLGWADVARAAYARLGAPAGLEPGLEAIAFFQAPGESYSFGSAVALVSIDRDTGRLTVERLVVADDCGRRINPLLVEGQLLGGLAQGLGQAVCEEIVHDTGGQLLTATLMDYAIPRADDMPPIVLEATETPSPWNPLGAKGVGEGGAIAAPPAVVNAVANALAPFHPPPGALDMPLRAERLWQALRYDGTGTSGREPRR